MSEVLQNNELNSFDDFKQEVLEAGNAPTEAEQKLEVIMQKIQDLRVYASSTYEEDEVILSVDGIPALSRKDLVAIKAKQKAGKSSTISIINATFACGIWNRLKKEIMHPVKVLYFDTEMKERDTWKMIQKTNKMAGLDLSADSENLMFFNLRKHTHSECRDIIASAIMLHRPDVVFIDGIVDLLADFNEVTQSQELVREHLRLAEEYDCCIIDVLHTNKGGDDHNMRGHLGTILSQKSTNVFECVKDNDNNVVTVKCADYRHAKVPNWSFSFDETGTPVPADELATELELLNKQNNKEKKAEKHEKIVAERIETLREIMRKEGTTGMTRKVLTEVLMKELGLGNSSVTTFISDMISKGVIKQGGYNGGLVLGELIIN